jgi:hypothetical protein
MLVIRQKRAGGCILGRSRSPRTPKGQLFALAHYLRSQPPSRKNQPEKTKTRDRLGGKAR